jgi:hypothetical protein
MIVRFTLLDGTVVEEHDVVPGSLQCTEQTSEFFQRCNCNRWVFESFSDTPNGCVNGVRQVDLVAEPIDFAHDKVIAEFKRLSSEIEEKIIFDRA